MGKRKFSGYLQMFLAFAGFIVTVLALIKWVLAWVQAFEVPTNPGLYKMACLGIAIFLVAWVWSLITSLTFFRKAK
jgi:hypothetical protein